MHSTQRQFSQMAKAARWAWLAAMMVCVTSGAYCWIAHSIEQAAMQSVAVALTRSDADPEAKAIALARFVHANGGTRRNPGWFGIPSWRATPLQVATTGGDCADKSRLLVALLSGIGLRATPVLCFDSVTGTPAHTMVEVEPVQGRHMVLDPAYNLWFPKPGGGYHDIDELRANPSIVPARVVEIQNHLPSARPRHEYYLRSRADYHTASTFHWNRGPLTKALFTIFQAVLGDSVFRLPRPIWLEDPILKGFLTAFLCALLLGAMPVLLRTVARRARTVSAAQELDSCPSVDSHSSPALV